MSFGANQNPHLVLGSWFVWLVRSGPLGAKGRLREQSLKPRSATHSRSGVTTYMQRQTRRREDRPEWIEWQFEWGTMFFQWWLVGLLTALAVLARGANSYVPHGAACQTAATQSLPFCDVKRLVAPNVLSFNSISHH